MSLVIEAVTKEFGQYPALKGVSLEVPSGSFLAILGPSGSGKTTLLRILGGLEFADMGRVLYDGLDWLAVPARERRAGFVFQHYALFRHMTVAKNIAFGLEIRKRGERPPKPEITRRVEELLKLVQLEGLGDRYPSQLSGGQGQRVALARALAIEPRMLLLDEPFGALDAKVRKDLRAWLRALQEQMAITTVFVTHDQEEALELADRVAVLNLGRIEQLGTPKELRNKPATPFVADFLGTRLRAATVTPLRPRAAVRAR
jgi:sulfate transport system ATP-binding protein